MPTSKQRDPKWEQYWRDTVAAWRSSGVSVREFCDRRGLPRTARSFGGYEAGDVRASHCVGSNVTSRSGHRKG